MHETVKEKEICASFDVSPQTAKVTATLHGECLMRTEKTLRLWVKDISRKHSPTDSNMLFQKARKLYRNFSEESPELSDTKPLTASYTDSGIGLDKKTQKLLERLHLQMKKSPHLQQSRRS